MLINLEGESLTQNDVNDSVAAMCSVYDTKTYKQTPGCPCVLVFHVRRNMLCVVHINYDSRKVMF